MIPEEKKETKLRGKGLAFEKRKKEPFSWTQKE